MLERRKIISHRIADDNIMTFNFYNLLTRQTDSITKNLIRFFILTDVCENEQQEHKNEYKESNC